MSQTFPPPCLCSLSTLLLECLLPVCACSVLVSGTASPVKPPLVFPSVAVASLNSAALWPELGYCIPSGSGCLCLHLRQSPFSPGTATPSSLWPSPARSRTEFSPCTPRVPAVTRTQGIGCLVMEIRLREGGRNLDYVDLRGEWEVRAWRHQVQATGWQRGWSPEGHVRPKEGCFQDGREESV